ncbi:MAG: ABC transporter permease subunit [Dehalococcoidia bacterium]|nr:ABC transporter permease subunit [Dehalococcoidia bacterium]
MLGKEWNLLFTDPNSALLVTLLPFAVIGQFILYVWLAFRFGGEGMLGNSVFQTALEKLLQAIPEVSALPVSEQLLVLLLNQFQFILLLIPVVIAIGIAAFSIVDEKLTGSLEALLATPVRTWELLLGKTLAGAIPALLMTWVSAGFFLLVVSLLGWGNLSRLVLTPSWLLSIFLLTPAVAILSFMLGVIGSSRAKDSKGAQNIALIVVFPILALIGIQVTGIIWFSTLRTLVLALVIIGADIVALRAAVHLFQRESIAIQWR